MTTNNKIPDTSIPYTNQEQSIIDTSIGRMQYFSKIPWKLYSTHWIMKPLSNERRRFLWRDYLKQVSSLHKDTLAYLWSEESSLTVPVHYHCLWATNKPISTPMMQDAWKAVAGNSHKTIDIKPCYSSGGIGYVLKQADRDRNNWDFSRNLDQFLGTPNLVNSQARRRYNRFVDRMNQCG